MQKGLSAEDIDRVGAAVLSGVVIAYPTETFYALGADPRNAGAINRIVEIKGRESDKPLLLIVDSMAMIREWVAAVPPALATIARHFWPGPLTAVMRARRGLHPALVSADGTVAIRLSPHPVAQALIRRCAVPLTGTSANRAGAEPARTAAHVRDSFAREEVGEILDGGATAGGPPSTLLDLTADPCKVLRHGAVSAERIAEVVRLL